MDDPIDELLRRASRAAERYQVPEQVAGSAEHLLAGMPDQQREHAGSRALLDAMVWIADTHQPHDAETCPTCGAIRNGLAVALGVIRAEVDVDFGRRLG